MSVKRGTEARISIPGTIYVNNVPIIIEDTQIGCATEVNVEISAEIEPLYTVESLDVERYIEGNLKITGNIRRAWVNIFYLQLLGLTETTNWNEVKFDLFVRQSSDPGSPAFYLKNCRFTSSDIRITAGGWLEEEYNFIAENIKLAETLYISRITEMRWEGLGFPFSVTSQRRVFFYSGYYIAFVINTDQYVVYKISTDKETWIQPSSGNPVITPGDGWEINASDFDILQVGNNFYLVLAEAVGGWLKIKKGTFINGEITWTSWVYIANFSPFSPNKPHVTRTEDGYLFVETTAENYSYGFRLFCIRSTYPDNHQSWLEKVAITNLESNYFISALTPYSENEVYISYFSLDNNRLRGKTFDGTNVGEEENISDYDVLFTPSFDMITDDYYRIHIVYETQEINGYNLVRHCVRDGEGWHESTIFQTVTTEFELPIRLSKKKDEILLSYSIFHHSDDQGEFWFDIDFRKWNGKWSSPVKLRRTTLTNLFDELVPLREVNTELAVMHFPSIGESIYTDMVIIIL